MKLSLKNHYALALESPCLTPGSEILPNFEFIEVPLAELCFDFGLSLKLGVGVRKLFSELSDFK